MTIWFTADQHFGHDRIREYAERPFGSVAQMDEEIIRLHNAVVDPKDTVYMLGDFTLKGARDAADYLSQLNGELLLVPGGHDDWAHKNRIYISKSGLAVQILDPLVLFDVDDGLCLTLCHYPMRSWDRSHYGMHHLHGHSHGAIGKFYASSDRQLSSGARCGWAMDVGVDTNNFQPISLDEVVLAFNKVGVVHGEDPAA